MQRALIIIIWSSYIVIGINMGLIKTEANYNAAEHSINSDNK